ncbi:hypothetical protein E4P40_05800 [Blastococcus sp. CT_GayMR20]|uniref:hypothetical protein n=1 Tax=Blastococcus sp. CT_GayMR20 TaxID=2559609 RepID=UPI001074085D|nr:hypothetical protein [Blastococcus sp. CT_GayMR20]TFV91540.1 hypothetical protein E4P40_05800 [Blastococcus sp. CT_GayMR20]
MRRTLVRSAIVGSAVLAAAVVSAGPAAAARGNPGVPAGAALEAADARSVVTFCLNDSTSEHPGEHAGWDEDSPVVERRNVGGICGGLVPGG